MNNIFKCIIIGIIQGITEFLPISSSGHIVLFGYYLNMDNLLLLSICAHIGTLFAVLICYKNKIFNLIKHPKNSTNINLIISTLPTIIIALIFNKFIENAFSKQTLIWGFLISAIALMIADLRKEGKNHINKKNALVTGIIQGMAILPGISRSGSTLTGGLLMGVEKNEMLDYSFLMSIPIIAGSAVYESINLFVNPQYINWFQIFIVIFISFVFGILSIKLMLKIVKTNKLYYFSFYLILLSLVAILF